MLKALFLEWSTAPREEAGPLVLLVLSSAVPLAARWVERTQSWASTRGTTTIGARTAQPIGTTIIGTIIITADGLASSYG
jgi:hypothetical protein